MPRTWPGPGCCSSASQRPRPAHHRRTCVQRVCTGVHIIPRFVLYRVRYWYGKHIYWSTEEHSSKTCSLCNSYRTDLGAAKVFTCPNPRCGLVEDRDVNAAINILRMNLDKFARFVPGYGQLMQKMHLAQVDRGKLQLVFKCYMLSLNPKFLF